jgi:4-hydroxy-tetrahydrodipicolinate synthase
MTAASTATYVISLTPFDGAGKTDFSAFRQHLGRMRSAGIGVYVGGGGSGEAHALALGEIAALASTAAEELRGKVPVRAMGREPRTAAAMIEWANALRDTGVEALQIYSLDAGHGYRPNAREQEAYFRDVLDAIDFPIVLSTHQYNGYLLAADLFDRLLADYPHIVGINATTPDVRYLAELIETVDGRAELHVGGPANVAPGLVRAIIDSFDANDLRGIFANYRRFMRLYSLNSRFGSITAIKVCLDVLGLPGGGSIRRPRLPLSEFDRDLIRRLLGELNLTDRELGKDQAH